MRALGCDVANLCRQIHNLDHSAMYILQKGPAQVAHSLLLCRTKYAFSIGCGSWM